MRITGIYENKHILVDTVTKTWEFISVTTPSTQKIIDKSIKDGTLKKREFTQEEIGEMTILSYH